MLNHKHLDGLGRCLIGFLLVALLAPAGHAATFRVLYRFGDAPDAQTPLSGLALGSDGRLYGATAGGGENGLWGAVYRLTPPSGPGEPWSEEVLHSFDALGLGFPDSMVTVGAAGELYGTSEEGGPLNYGGVWRLDNTPGWPYTAIHVFGNLPDGAVTSAPVSFGQDGLLYGTNEYKGLQGDGTAFNLSPLGDTTAYAVIEKFGSSPKGHNPAGLIPSRDGRFFGVAEAGGNTTYGNPFGSGTAFSLQRTTAGTWREITIHDFGAPGDATSPFDPPFLGEGPLKHLLLGCAPGGANNQGAIYSLTQPGGGSGLWTEAVLYSFGGQAGDPSEMPFNHCSVTQDQNGKLYGVTQAGGSNGVGAFFELDPPAPGSTLWTETVLHSFSAADRSGYTPFGVPLRIGKAFYGTTSQSRGGFGLVYELKP